MYRLGKRPHKYHKNAIKTVIFVFCVGVIIFVYTSLNVTFNPQSTITNDAATQKAYLSKDTAETPVTESLFSMVLPVGWQKTQSPGNLSPSPDYYYHSTSIEAKQLALYLGNVPEAMPLNKIVIVTGMGNGLAHEKVSDNCAEYTQPSKTQPETGVATGKWQGIEFICDLGNYQRNVIGTVSAEGHNQVLLTGEQAGRRKVFFVYTDNSSRPDYSTLYKILESFKLK